MALRLAKLVAPAALAAAMLAATAAIPEALPKPPLKPGEVLAVTRNGCIMIATPSVAVGRTKFIEQAARIEWRGPCRNGLVHGAGQIAYHPPDGGQVYPYADEFFHGRVSLVRRMDGRTVWGLGDGRYASLSDRGDVDAPVWRTSEEEAAGRHGTDLSVDKQSIQTSVGSCYGGACTYEIVQYDSTSEPTRVTRTPCPNPNSYVGCEALWRDLAAPLIASYRVLRAEVERREPGWRAELVALNAARDARFAALDAASDAAFARSQAAAEAESGKAGRDFKAKLTTANAGQLFAMADEFERAGDTDKAGQALRALLTRFPDHGLAVTAAQRLTALPAATSPVGVCNAPAEEARHGMELRAAMDRIPASNAVGKYEAILMTMQRSAGAWSRCPTHPSSPAKLRTYRTAYVEAARKCAMISPTGACTPNLH